MEGARYTAGAKPVLLSAGSSTAWSGRPAAWSLGFLIRHTVISFSHVTLSSVCVCLCPRRTPTQEAGVPAGPPVDRGHHATPPPHPGGGWQDVARVAVLFPPVHSHRQVSQTFAPTPGGPRPVHLPPHTWAGRRWAQVPGAGP